MDKATLTERIGELKQLAEVFPKNEYWEGYLKALKDVMRILGGADNGPMGDD